MTGAVTYVTYFVLLCLIGTDRMVLLDGGRGVKDV